MEAQTRRSVRAIQRTLWIRAFEYTASAERNKTRKDTDGPSGYRHAAVCGNELIVDLRRLYSPKGRSLMVCRR